MRHLTRPPRTDPFGFPCSVDPLLVRGSDTQTIGGANWGVWFRTKEGGTISKISLEVVTSSGNISLAVYGNTGVGRAAVPGTRKVTTGAIACPATGVHDVALGSSVVVLPGDWLFLSADNNTATFRSGLGGSATNNTWITGRCMQAVTSHPAPSEVPALTPLTGKPILLVGLA